MRNLKKALSLALALVMLLGMMMVGAGAAKFEDVPNGAANQEAIEVMAAINILKGDEGTKDFRPDDTLTRAEAAVIISKVLLTPAVVEKLDVTTTRFTDMADYDWAIPYVEACATPGIIAGNGDGTYGPGDELTGVAFAKMLLVTLGFDPDNYNGKANWELLVQQDAIKAKLDTNGVSVSSKELSRANAAQMAFNALTYSPEGGTIYPVEKTGETSLEFTTAQEAALYAAILKDEGWTLGASYPSTKGSLAETRFNLKKTTGHDSVGHATVTWTAPGTSVTIAANVPTLTYTEAVKASDIYKDLGLTAKIEGNKNASDKNVYYVDGVNFRYKDKGASDTADEKYTNKTRVYTDFQFELSATSKQVFGGNGATTEVYYDGTNVRIIVTNTYAGQVTKVNEAKGDAKASIEILVFGDGQTVKCQTEGFEKDDIVIFNWTKRPDGIDMVPNAAGDALVDNTAGLTASNVALAEKVEEVLVSRKVAGKSITAAGTTYSFSEKGSTPGGVAAKEYNFLTDGTTKYDLYLDAEGNIIRAQLPGGAAAAAAADYVFVLTVDGTTQGSSMLGNEHKLVKYVDTTGATHIVKVATANLPTVSTTAGAYTVAEDPANEDMYRFTAVASDSVSAVSASSNTQLKAGKPALTTSGTAILANANTLFVLKTSSSPEAYTAYTGIKSIPSYTEDTLAIYAMVKDGFAQAVYVDVTGKTPAGATSSDLVYIVSATAIATGYDADTKTSWSEYAAIVDDEITTITATTGTAISAGFGTLTKDNNGYVTGVTAVSGSPVGAALAGIKAIASTGGVLTVTKSDNGKEVYGVSDDVEIYLISGSEAKKVEMKDITGNTASGKTRTFQAVQASTTDETLVTIVVTEASAS